MPRTVRQERRAVARRRARAGFTLPELLVAATLLVLVCAAIGTLLVSQQRIFNRTRSATQMQRDLRTGLGLLPLDLRGASRSAGDIVALQDSAIQLRATIGSSIVCVRPSAALVDLPPLNAARNALTEWHAQPLPGDTALLYDENTAAGPEDDRWLPYRIVAVGQVTTTCIGAPFTDATLDPPASKPRFRVQLDANPPATVVVGAPVRFLRSVRYSLYRPAGADADSWYLGYREHTGGVWGQTEPIAGPFESASGPRTGHPLHLLRHARRRTGRADGTERRARGPQPPRPGARPRRHARHHRAAGLRRRARRPAEPPVNRRMRPPRFPLHEAPMRPLRSRPTTRRPLAHGRRGLAMPMALLVLVVLTTLAASAFTAARQTFRGGRNTLIEQRAMAIAEYGLNQQVANWPTQLNLPAPRGLAVGRVDSTNVWVAAGDTSRVRITRLTNMLYHVESIGRASIPNPQLTAQRSVGAILRLAYPTIEPRGAITAGGRVDLQGSAIVDGRDYVPYSWDTSIQWADSLCTGLRGTLMPAIAVPPGTNQVDSAARNIPSGAPKVIFDPAAADSNTYVRFGTESWNSLTANANIRFTGGAQPGNSIAPLDSAGVCRTSNMQNWGEPFRGAGHVASCANYFPIIYVDGDLDLQSNGRGQGILLINGNLKLRGTFDWVGLIIVRDDVDRGNGSANVTGAIMARNVNLADGGSSWTGNQTVRYSKCAVESALRGSAILVRARERSWTQLY